MTPSPETPAPAAVRLDRVTKAFGSRVVLDDVTFEVRAGTAFIILGRSGTGKTVTLRHIIRLMRPDRAGSSSATTRSARSTDPSCRASGAGWDSCFRTRRSSTRFRSAKTSLFRCGATPVGDREIRGRAADKLAAVGLEKDYDALPRQLSGGMRKRAGLARALALDPELLLVDEPSAGLDPITAGEIDNLLLALKEKAGTTLVVVTHNIPSARRIGDELLMLDQGRVVAHGTVEELERSDEEVVHAFMASRNAG